MNRNFYVNRGTAPEQVDFPAGVERSRKGAVHFMPGSTVELTEDEVAHLAVKHSGLLACLTDVTRKAKSAKKAAVAFGAAVAPRRRIVRETADAAPAPEPSKGQ